MGRVIVAYARGERWGSREARMRRHRWVCWSQRRPGVVAEEGQVAPPGDGPDGARAENDAGCGMEDGRPGLDKAEGGGGLVVGPDALAHLAAVEQDGRNAGSRSAACIAHALLLFVWCLVHGVSSCYVDRDGDTGKIVSPSALRVKRAVVFR